MRQVATSNFHHAQAIYVVQVQRANIHVSCFFFPPNHLLVFFLFIMSNSWVLWFSLVIFGVFLHPQFVMGSCNKLYILCSYLIVAHTLLRNPLLRIGNLRTPIPHHVIVALCNEMFNNSNCTDCFVCHTRTRYHKSKCQRGSNILLSSKE